MQKKVEHTLIHTYTQIQSRLIGIAHRPIRSIVYQENRSSSAVASFESLWGSPVASISAKRTCNHGKKHSKHTYNNYVHVSTNVHVHHNKIYITSTIFREKWEFRKGINYNYNVSNYCVCQKNESRPYL